MTELQAPGRGEDDRVTTPLLPGGVVVVAVDGEDGQVYAGERIEEVGAGGGGGLEDLVGLGCIWLCLCIAVLLEPFLDLELWVPTWEVGPRSDRSARTSLLTLNFTGLDPNENRRRISIVLYRVRREGLFSWNRSPERRTRSQRVERASSRISSKAAKQTLHRIGSLSL